MSEPTQEEIDAALKAGESAAVEDIKKDADKVAGERDELARELDEAKAAAEEAKVAADEARDKCIRIQADWENFRKRTAAERVQERERACEHLVENLLPALDDLEHAIEHSSSINKEVADGISAVYDKIMDVLSKEKVEKINPLNQIFDPNEAQAVQMQENKDVANETVLGVMRAGYKMAGRVIRPAMVVVSSGGPAPVAEPADEVSDKMGDEAGDKTD